MNMWHRIHATHRFRLMKCGHTLTCVYLSYSDDAGVFIVQSKNNKHIMITGHLEYDATTLSDEYFRDIEKDPDNTEIPINYFPNNDP